MRKSVIQVRGTYHYGTHAAIELALAAARARIDEDDPADFDSGWLDSLVRVGTTLRVNTTISVAADRFVVAAVMDALADSALDGVVETFRDGQLQDWFPSQADKAAPLRRVGLPSRSCWSIQPNGRGRLHRRRNTWPLAFVASSTTSNVAHLAP